MKFEDLVKTLDPSMRVEIYQCDSSSIREKMIFNGALKNLKDYPDRVLRIIPQSTSREVYLEISVY